MVQDHSLIRSAVIQSPESGDSQQTSLNTHRPPGSTRQIRHLRMRGDKPVSTVRTNGGAERRPSYPGDQRVKHANRATKIWVKVAMGIAYFLCVSVAAFFLAIYYVLFWTPDSHNNATKTNGSCLRG